MEKKNLHFIIYPIFAIIIVLVIISIIIIWKPTFSKVSKNAINTYADLNYEEEIKNYYMQYLNTNLKLTNFDELYNKIDTKYVEKLGIASKEELKTFLKDNSFISMNFNILNIDVYEQDSRNYLIVTYNVRNETRYITITENKPYDFKISFMDSYNLENSVSNFELEGDVDNIKYSFNIIESTSDSIKFKLTITNNSEKTVVYDFSYLDSIQLIYDEGKIVNMTSTANSNESKYTLNPGSMTTVEAFYVLPYNDQLSITGAKINNANVNGTSYSIEI